MRTGLLRGDFVERLRHRWGRPVDPAGLAVFRMLFGLTMCVGALRYLHNGWVDRFFVQPTHHLKYWGFEWVVVGSPAAMHAALWAIAALSFCVAIGVYYRVAIVLFAILFTYVELIDVASYLNHYVLVSMTAVILSFLPAHATWSVDAWRRARRDKPALLVPQLSYDWLRFQVAAVWTSASIAKMTPDWLLHAQPLNVWLTARRETPLIGQFLDVWEVALLASWGGMLYDLLIAWFLLWRRTRAFAFVAVLGFHFMTFVWFPIGMFPVIMVVVATIFFDPSWPRRWLRRPAFTPPAGARVNVRWRARLAVAWAVMLVVLPVRFIAYGGDVLWHEQGMRWAFKVMCREKNGAVTYRVHLPSQQRTFQWSPRTWFTPHQVREMSGQPDVILRVAHRLGESFREDGEPDVEVYVDAIASLNGRSPAPLIDPTVNLMEVRDGLAPADWILPGPTQPPPRLGRQLLFSPKEMASR